MLKDARKLELVGANFENVTSLDVFEPQGDKKTKYIKAALLYGRNGTGKSTVAQAFRTIAGEGTRKITSALLDGDGARLSLTDDERAHIFVFDEEFIEKKVKLREEDLETIVLLGPTGDIEESLKAARKRLEAAEVALSDHKTKMEEFQDRGNPKSPLYYQDRLRIVLQGDDAWAGRDKEINGARRNTGVRDDTYLQFVHLHPAKTKDSLLVDFQEGKQRLEAAKSGTASIGQMVPGLPRLDDDYDTKVRNLLAEEIQRPTLSEREQFLLRLVEEGQASRLIEIQKVFSESELVTCPYCLQPVSKPYRLGLVESVRKVLSRTVEDHRDQLGGYLLNTIEMDLAQYSELGSYAECCTLLDKLNAATKTNNALIQDKINNPYSPITENMYEIATLYSEFEVSLEALEQERIAFNQGVTDVQRIVGELKSINSEIAYYDVRDLANQYDLQRQQHDSVMQRLHVLENDLSTCKQEVEDLEAKKRNVNLAVESINACMSYIFFSKNRLAVELIDGEYRLRSHGRRVRPCDVSVGERNILALSYFFTSLWEGKEQKGAYSDECLIVLDDPVSSYDLENKVGILSFLCYELRQFLSGNTYSRALIMTHDLPTVYDIEKTLQEVIAPLKGRSPGIGIEYSLLELRDGQIERFAYRNRQEYSELIKTIYEFACNHADDQELVIGNVMRQVLEAYARFEHRCTIEEISTDEQILAQLPEDEYRSYFRNLMYRLVLHGGSHLDERVRSLSDMRFFSLVSAREKKRTARDILCLIYLLNEDHLNAHLRGIDASAQDNLRAWCEDIRARAVVMV